jgi:hypothetical protein
VLKVGAPDSDVYFGWFSSADQQNPPVASGSFLGVHIGGPTRVGHAFNPRLTTSAGTAAKVDTAPVLKPEKTFDWSMAYDPAANGGQGELRVTLGGESATLALKKGVKEEGARFDRFGLFNSNIGGQLVRIYFDDLKYTATRPTP